MKRILSRSLILFCLAITIQSTKADSVVGSLAYPLPPGGWTYIFNGDQASTNSTVGFVNLDGTWDHNNGSDSWDLGAPIGGIISSSNKPGGVMTITNAGHASEANVTYLRMQDAGRSPNYSSLANNGCGGCSL